MSFMPSPTIDQLLGDSLIQAVMRADKVEPQVLRTLLADTADRLAVRGERQARLVRRHRLPKPPIDRRLPPRAASSPRLRPAPAADVCGSAICC